MGDEGVRTRNLFLQIARESVELSQHVDSPLDACMTSKGSECGGTKVVTRSSATRLPKD